MTAFFQNACEAEKLTFRLTQRYFPKDLSKYELSANILAQTLKEINLSFKNRELKPENKFATVLLAYRFLIASKCVFNIGVWGYYYETQILMRSMSETVIYCLSFQLSNDCARKWMAHGLRLREAKQVIKNSSASFSKEAYSLLSEYVHSDKQAIARTLSFRENLEIACPTGPQFMEKGYGLFREFRALNIALLEVLVAIFANDLEEKTKNSILAFILKEKKEIQTSLKSA
jgi:hypothetical protein